MADHDILNRIPELKRQIQNTADGLERLKNSLDDKNRQISELQLQKVTCVVLEAVAAATPSDPTAKHTAKRSVACRNDTQYSAALDGEISKFRKHLVDLRNVIAEALCKGGAKANFAADITAAWAKAVDISIEAKEQEVERLKEEVRNLSDAAIKHLAAVTRPVTADEFKAQYEGAEPYHMVPASRGADDSSDTQRGCVSQT